MKWLTKTTHRICALIFGEEGSTLAEMAIMVPFLAVMLAAVTEFGRYFQTHTTLAKSVRSAARHLSNHPFDATEQAKAKNLVVCGKLTTCNAGEEILPNLTTNNVCIESTGSPQPITITVRIPETGGSGCGAPYLFRPLFDLGALLDSPTYSLAKPIHPRTTMYFMLDD